MVTLKDVAKEAGVSIATVSCALSGTKPVRPATKNKIMDAVEKLRYVPNAAARSLKSTSSKNIGVILPEMKNRFYTEIFDGLSSYLQNHGYFISIAFSNESPDIEQTKIDEFVSQNVAGIVLVTCQPSNASFFRTHILQYEIPLLFLDREAEILPGSFLGFNNYDSAYRITENLIQKGMQDFAVMCGSTDFSTEQEIIRGCSDALAASNRGLNSPRICITNMTREDAFNGFMRCYSKTIPEVLFASTREIASGIQTAVDYCGFSLPKNMILLSYSGDAWANAYEKNGIFLIPRSTSSLGERAARTLLQNIEAPTLFEPVSTRLPDLLNGKYDLLPLPDHVTRTSIQTGRSEKKLRILAINNPTVNALQFLCSHFTRQTGIEIDIELEYNNLFQRISNSFEDITENYDCYTYDVPWLEYMAQNLCLADITHFVEGSEFSKDHLFPENLRNCRIGDRYYGIPFSGGTQLLFYRRDFFESWELQKEYQRQSSLSLRAPRTWKEYNTIASFFTRAYNPSSPTEFGASLAGALDIELAPEILIRIWAFGGSLWDSYQRPTINTKENYAAFQSILETLPYIPGTPFQSDIKQSVQDFCEGKTAMLITYSEFAQQISSGLKEHSIGRIGTHTLPGDHPASVGWNIGVNPFSPNRDEIFAFLSWLCQWDTSFYLTVLNGASPVTAPYHNYELQKLYPWLSQTEISLSHATRRNTPYQKNRLVLPPKQIEQVLCDVLKRIVNDKLSIKEALEEGQENADHLFKTYGYPTFHRY